MIPNALATTLALALAVPGGVFAVDAVNDDAIPGLQTADFVRGHGPLIGHGHDRPGHNHTHGPDAAHGRETGLENARERSGGHAYAHAHGHDHAKGHDHAHGGAHFARHAVHMVAHCLTSDNHTTEDCIGIANGIANTTVTHVEACLAEDGSERCERHMAAHAGPWAKRVAECLQDEDRDTCVDKVATHLLCFAAHVAEVEPPVECPEPAHAHDKDGHGPGPDDASDDAADEDTEDDTEDSG